MALLLRLWLTETDDKVINLMCLMDDVYYSYVSGVDLSCSSRLELSKTFPRIEDVRYRVFPVINS